MCNDEWCVLFSDAQVRELAFVEYPDHHPILISLKEKDFFMLQKSFKF